ncbi:hypothetical protein [Roseateles saccharophilus]|uniref:Uncharacterized protein n=1 Tax=Roseateles saccharophilus TaxID=304 RepID=A0A4R3VJL8_ROSSA|nr:hypothetical protein [Roseateles saccharophilus]MDG0832527.1 hypothetical protein [Roseateles saccharophilus]TCV03989.1 hypothetical protein EV671_1002259 [Roseateles saccharophilus]
MNYRILLIAPLAAVVLSVSAAGLRVPAGWFVFSSPPASSPVGGYEIGIDPASEAGGTPSLTVHSVGTTVPMSPMSFGVAEQSVTGYGGKRVCFSGQLKAESLRGWAGLFLGEGDPGQLAGLMGARPGAEKQVPPGTAVPADGGWHEVSVVLDVPADTPRIDFGLALTGEGQVWARDLHFEIVGPEVAPTTTRLGIDLPEIRRTLAWTNAQSRRYPPAPLQNPALD